MKTGYLVLNDCIILTYIQVFVVINDKEELDFPQFDDVYGSDMESEDEYYSDEEDYDGEPNAKRSRAAVRLRCIWTFLMSL
jgi:hypothetical protein